MENDKKKISSIILLVLFIIASMSFLFLRPALQTSVEAGQVLAGIVKYPTSNLFYYYQLKAWSFLNQISGICLHLGLNERIASLLLGVICTNTSFLAIFLIAFYFSTNNILSLFITVSIILIQLYPQSPVYPISFFGSGHNNGEMGLSFFLLTLAFLLNDKKVLFLLCLAILPSIHITFGACFIFCYITTSLFTTRTSIIKLKRNELIFFLIGVAITGLSYLWQHSLITNQLSGFQLIKLSNAELRKIYLNYILYWSAHQKMIISYNLLDITACLVLVVVFLKKLLKKFNTQAHTFGDSFLIILTLFSLSTFFLICIPSYLPMIFTQLIPGRFLNIVIIISIIYLFSESFNKIQSNILIILSFILITFCMSIIGRIPFINFNLLKTACIVLLGHSYLFSIIHSLKKIQIKPPMYNLITWTLILFIPLRTLSYFRNSNSTMTETQAGLENKKIFNYLNQQQKTTLLAGKMGRIQLKSISPIIIDTDSIDFFPMMPEILGNAHDLLLNLYGLDISQNTTFIQTPNGSLPIQHKEIWELRAQNEWIELARRYQFTYILVPKDWKLHLKEDMQNNNYRLYSTGI